jgi:hypothetical protein
MKKPIPPGKPNWELVGLSVSVGMQAAGSLLVGTSVVGQFPVRLIGS